jgi:hypothetical protein
MSREIKFRGKRVDKNEWAYGSLIQKEGYSAIVIFDKGHDAVYNAYLELQVIPESVGQFIKTTGNVDIYEGDKLRGDEDNLSCYCLIEWDEENGRFQINDYGYGISIGEGSQEIIGDTIEKVDEYIYDIEDISVSDLIGNIHENKN